MGRPGRPVSRDRRRHRIRRHIGSSDIINGEVKSADIGNNQVQSVDVRNESVTGADIKDQSGVDTCTHGTARFGELCVGVADEHHTWLASTNLCAALGLRLPSIGEAFVLAQNFDLPNVDENEDFWTDEHVESQTVWTVTDAGGFFDPISVNSTHETVCITTPTN